MRLEKQNVIVLSLKCRRITLSFENIRTPFATSMNDSF